MAIVKKQQQRRRVIDLDGPDGNAWVLLGYASNFGKQLGWNEAKRKQVQDEMKSGDYENLIQVFDKYFGDFVDLERSSKDEEDDE